jgi:hypothetical protein
MAIDMSLVETSVRRLRTAGTGLVLGTADAGVGSDASSAD